MPATTSFTVRPLDASTWDDFAELVELFEEYGFARGRQVGKHAWIVSTVVDPN